MLSVVCKGSPYEIGYAHGKAAPELIGRCIGFYTRLFQKNCGLSWQDVLQTASQFGTEVHRKWPAYYEEMEGIAAGSKYSLLDIIALNVRTEIAFGKFTDGCTAASWTTAVSSFLGQNWDWETEQAENLILLTIIPRDDEIPSIKMVTEAGLIGKIGLNDSGVGVCLNAIRAKGCDPTRMPVHLALRKILESSSVDTAVAALKAVGVASAAHFLIADPVSAVGLETTSSTFAELKMDSQGRIFHSNHLIGHHEGVIEPFWLPDSIFRLQRINVLADELQIGAGEKGVGLKNFAEMFADEENFPASVCRAEEGESAYATLFNIAIDLKSRQAIVTVGRPCSPSKVLEIDFGDC